MLCKIIGFLNCIKNLAIFKIYYLILRVDTQSVTVEVGTVFCSEPHDKYFRLEDHTDSWYSALLSWLNSRQRQFINKLVWLCFSKTLLKQKTSLWGHSLLTAELDWGFLWFWSLAFSCFLFFYIIVQKTWHLVIKIISKLVLK